MTSPHRDARTILLVTALALLGCGPAPSTPDTRPNHKPEPTEPAASDEPGEAVPIIAADEAEFDFGTVSPTGSVTHGFKLVNRGTADLKIEKVERT